MSAKNTTKPAKKAGATVSKKSTVSKKVAPKKAIAKAPVAKKPTPKKVVAPKKVIKKPTLAKAPAKKLPAKSAGSATKRSAVKPVAKPVKKTPAPKAPVKSPKAAAPAPKKAESKKPAPKKAEAVLVAKPRKPLPVRYDKPTHGALYVRAGRHFYTEDRSIIEMPELIAAQLDSYKTFVEYGLREALESVFPVSDFSEERVEIHFKDFEIEAPRYTPKECRRKNLNYESYLRVKLQMLNKETGEIKEDTVFL